MRISDWRSDVCSSDLLDDLAERTDRFTGADLEDLVRRAGLVALRKSLATETVPMADFDAALPESRASVTPEMEQEYEQMAAKLEQDAEIGRATWRERVWQYVCI